MRKIAIMLAACAAVLAHAGVREQFANPPPESRLQAWYHWTTTGITDECLAADNSAAASGNVNPHAIAAKKAIFFIFFCSLSIRRAPLARRAWEMVHFRHEKVHLP